MNASMLAIFIVSWIYQFKEMKLLLITIFLHLSLPLFCQDTLWTYTSIGIENDEFSGFTTCPQSEIYITGISHSLSIDPLEKVKSPGILLTKLDSLGELKWRKVIRHEHQIEQVRNIIICKNKIIINGKAYNPKSYKEKDVLMCFDLDGNHLWLKEFDLEIDKIKKINDDKFVITRARRSGPLKIEIYDSLGNELLSNELIPIIQNKELTTDHNISIDPTNESINILCKYYNTKHNRFSKKFDFALREINSHTFKTRTYPFNSGHYASPKAVVQSGSNQIFIFINTSQGNYVGNFDKNNYEVFQFVKCGSLADYYNHVYEDNGFYAMKNSSHFDADGENYVISYHRLSQDLKTNEELFSIPYPQIQPSVFDEQFTKCKNGKLELLYILNHKMVAYSYVLK